MSRRREEQAASLLAALRALLGEICESETAANLAEIDPATMQVPDLLASLHTARKLLQSLQRLYANRPDP